MSRTASDDDVSAVPVATETRSRLQAFRALRYRDFRFLWIRLIVSSVGMWMQIIALIGGPLTVVICATIVGSYALYLLVGRPVIRTL